MTLLGPLNNNTKYRETVIYNVSIPIHRYIHYHSSHPTLFFEERTFGQQIMLRKPPRFISWRPGRTCSRPSSNSGN